jgi:DNA-binding cell septation regulator SpoVG
MEAKPMNGIDDIIRNPGFLPPPVTVKRTVTSTGARITTQIKADDSEDSEEAKPLIGCEPESGVNALASENVRSDCQNGSVKEEVNVKMSLGESLKEMNTNVMSEEECLRAQINEEQPKEPEVVRVKEEPDGRSDCPDGLVKDEVKASTRMSFDEFLKVTNTKVMSEEECLRTQINEEQPKKPEVVRVKEEPDGHSDCPDGLVKDEVKASTRMSFDEFLKVTNTKVMSEEECLRTQIKEEQPREVVRVKQEPNGVEDKRLVRENVRTDCPDGWVKDEVNASKRMSFDEFLKATDTKVISGEELLTTPVNVERPKEPEAIKVKEEPDVGFEGNRPSVPEKLVSGMSSQEGLLLARYTKSDGESAISHEKKLEPKDSEKAELPNGSRPNVRVKEEPALGAEKKVCVKEQSVGSNFSSKSHNVKKEIDEDRRISSGLVQDGDFPEEPDWFLVGRTIVTALSTTKGRKLADNEIVDFTFPSPHWRHNAQWIVRFSTKRFGEVHLIGLQFSCVV